MNAAGISTDFLAGYGWTGTEWEAMPGTECRSGGQYYYVDVTWNDCLSSDKYVLISYDQMSYDHVEQLVNPQNRIM